MATVSAKEIKNRIRSMQATKQITKAMEMVASAKLRHAQASALSARPYFEILGSAIADMVNSNTDLSLPYLTRRPVKMSAYVVIAGDRGLAGGYNSNILKLAAAEMESKNTMVLPIGKITVDHFKSHGVAFLADSCAEAAAVSIGDCFSIARQLSNGYLRGEYDEIYVCYTSFLSVLSQRPAVLRLLPLERSEKGSGNTDILYEPDSREVFSRIVPEYLGGVLYSALCESRCSELAARRNAMNTATQNADEMIDDLRQTFNQTRQAAITSQIIDIIAGS